MADKNNATSPRPSGNAPGKNDPAMPQHKRLAQGGDPVKVPSQKTPA